MSTFDRCYPSVEEWGRADIGRDARNRIKFILSYYLCTLYAKSLKLYFGRRQITLSVPIESRAVSVDRTRCVRFMLDRNPE